MGALRPGIPLVPAAITRPGPAARPAMRRKRLDLPAALAPITTTTPPPGRAGVVMSSSTCRRP